MKEIELEYTIFSPEQQGVFENRRQTPSEFKDKNETLLAIGDYVKFEKAFTSIGGSPLIFDDGVGRITETKLDEYYPMKLRSIISTEPLFAMCSDVEKCSDEESFLYRLGDN